MTITIGKCGYYIITGDIGYWLVVKEHLKQKIKIWWLRGYTITHSSIPSLQYFNYFKLCTIRTVRFQETRQTVGNYIRRRCGEVRWCSVNIDSCAFNLVGKYSDFKRFLTICLTINRIDSSLKKLFANLF